MFFDRKFDHVDTLLNNPKFNFYVFKYLEKYFALKYEKKQAVVIQKSKNLKIDEDTYFILKMLHFNNLKQFKFFFSKSSIFFLNGS